MARELETVIRISGDVEKTLSTAIERAVEAVKGMSQESIDAASAAGKLAEKINDQRNELKRAQKQYESYVIAGEEASDEARALAKRITQLSGDLRGNEDMMDAARRAAQRLADGYDEVDDAARDAGDGFTILKGAASNLVSSGIQAVIGAATDAVSSIYGLSEITREFRQDMGTLETAFDSAGFTTEQATDTWKDLYAIFGEDDRAVEAANNIARIADSQAELDQWTRITTGIWGTYQDALPVESLAEAAAETMNTGTVTGALADALNWSSEAASMFSKYMSDDVTTAEDAFNVALSKCTTEAERNALITDTLTALYGDAADKYRETAGSIIEANEANADQSLSLAELGEKIEPVTTAVTEGFNDMLEKGLEWAEGVDWEAVAETVGGTFEAIGNGIDWVAENIEYIAVLAGGFGAALIAFNWASIVGWVGTIKGAVSGLWGVLSANPIFAVIGLVTALTAGVIWLYQNWDFAKQKLEEFGASVDVIWSNISAWVTGAIDTIGQYFPVFAGYLSGWWSSIQDAVGNVQAIFGGLIDFIGNIFAGNWSAAWQNIVDIFSNIFGMIGNLAKAPINAVVSAVNTVINGINGMGFEIPDWVPVVGGKAFSINIPNIPMLATGGFTTGPSIAGEAGTEAVISFDPAYRQENLGYWARAGQILRATDEDFSLSGAPGGTTVIDMGGVTFAPNVSITGKADKESVIKAIRDEYPEFLDMLEEWLYERGLTVYG